MVGGVPVAGGDDEVVVAGGRERVDLGGDRVALGHRQCPAGCEVVLEVDYEERSSHEARNVAARSRSPWPASTALSIWSRISPGSGSSRPAALAASATSPASLAARASGKLGSKERSIIWRPFMCAYGVSIRPPLMISRNCSGSI